MKKTVQDSLEEARNRFFCILFCQGALVYKLSNGLFDIINSCETFFDHIVRPFGNGEIHSLPSVDGETKRCFSIHLLDDALAAS